MRTLSLSEIFQTLQRSSATGVLRLSSTEGGCDLVFDEGVIIAVNFRETDPIARLVQRLVAVGVLADGDLELPDATPTSAAGAFELLSQSGQVSEEEARQYLEEQAFDELCSIFIWQQANFLFREAGGDDPEAALQVEAARKLQIRIDVNVLLMESARRMDEWNQVRERLPSDHAVLIPESGREMELATVTSEYPGKAVARLIDGQHSVGEIVALTPVTYLDTHLVLHDLLESKLIRVLDGDEVEASARATLAGGDPERAAAMLRYLLRAEPERESAGELMAQALEQAGGGPEAAEAYAQYALSLLRRKQSDAAIAAARRGVEIGGRSVQHMVLVRCLIEHGSRGQAIDELMQLAISFREQDQLDDARSACLKVLQLEPGHEAARRELAQVFARDSGDNQSDADSVICVQCGEVNPREHEQCRSCGASLQMECVNCKRVVGVSDRICIFCGQDIHQQVEHAQKGHGGPDTDHLLNPDAVSDAERDKGTDHWQSALREGLNKARLLEEQGDLRGAVEEWKRLAQSQVDKSDIQQHVRGLEALIHDREVERLIVSAHKLRRGRRFFRAGRSYRKALQLINKADARYDRLRELVGACRKAHLITGSIYSLALIALAVTGWLLVQPQYWMEAYRVQLRGAETEVEQALAEEDPIAAYRGIADLLERNRPEPRIAERAGVHYQRFMLQFQNARTQLAEQSLEHVDALLQDDQLADAETALATFRRHFGSDLMATRVGRVAEQIEHRQKLKRARELSVQEARERLAEVQELEAEGDLQAALERYRTLRSATEPVVAETAEAAVDRLEPQLRQLEQVTAETLELSGSLSKRRRALVALLERAERWGRDETLRSRIAAIDDALAAAKRAYEQLPRRADEATLAAFIGEHGGTVEAVAAQARLDELRREHQLQEQRFDQLSRRYHEARESGDWQRAWKAGRLLHERYELERLAGVELPLQIDCGVAGARVFLDERALGQCDQSGRMLWWHGPDAGAEIRIVRAGFEDLRVELDSLQQPWLLRAELQRILAWTWDAGNPVHRVTILGDGRVLVSSGEQLIMLDHRGEPSWHRSFADDSSLGGGEANWQHFIPSGEDGLLVPHGSGGLALIDRDGEEQRRFEGPRIVDRPARYHNELLGELRIAFVADGLYAGDLEDGFQRLPRAGACRFGPWPLSDGVDLLLLAGRGDGSVVATEETDGSLRWRHDSAGRAIAAMLRLDPAHLLICYQGGHVSCLQVDGRHARERWSKPLEGFMGQAAADPEGPWLAAGSRLVQLAPGDGTERASIELAGRASGVLATRDGTLVAGYVGPGKAVGVRAYRDGRQIWQRRTTEVVTALAISDSLVIVATSEGLVHGIDAHRE